VVRPRRRRKPDHYRYLRSVYKGKSLVSSSRLRWGALALVLGIYVVDFVGGEHGLVHRFRLGRELGELRAQNARLERQKERLLIEVQHKEDDPLSLEHLAREKYWMIGPDEIIYRFEDDEVVPEVNLFEDADSLETEP
jgi:cell division protein FtsB